MNAIDGERKYSPNKITAILVRRKWQMLAVFLLVVAGVTLGTLRMPKQYSSHMKILVKNERADMVVTANSNIGSGYQGAVSEEQINTEIELLNSSSLLQQVVEKCGLDKRESSRASAVAERGAIAIEKALSRLQKDLSITPVRKANVIEVDYTSTDPRVAVAVLRQLADSYLEAHLKLHSTPGTYEFFASQTAYYENQLGDAEAKLADFRQRDNIVMFSEEEDAILRKASEAEAALSQVEASIREYTDKIADSRTQLAAASPRVVTQSRSGPNQYSVDHLSAMIADLQNRRTELLTKYRSDDRLIAQLDKEISDTQYALEKATKANGLEESTDINPVSQSLEIGMAKDKADLAGMDARRQALALQVQSYRQQLMRLGNATSQYDDLTRTRKEAEDNYLLYARKTEEARIAESLDRQKISNVAIADAPVEPHLPSKPNVPLNLALGILLGGLLSVGTAFAAEYLRQAAPSVHLDAPPRIGGASNVPELLPSELEALTGLAVLAIVDRS